jgi:hypothetical protein
LTDPQQWVITRPIAQWRKAPIPELNKRPTIFILG